MKMWELAIGLIAFVVWIVYREVRVAKNKQRGNGHGHDGGGNNKCCCQVEMNQINTKLDAQSVKLDAQSVKLDQMNVKLDTLLSGSGGGTPPKGPHANLSIRRVDDE